MISFDEFKKIDLTAGRIISAEEHPNADKLQVLKVDIGEDSPRTLVAALKGHYQPEELKGKEVIVVANLEPVKLRGIESHGMLLAAQDGDTVTIVTPEKTVSPGSRVS